MHSFVPGPLFQFCSFTADIRNCPAGSTPPAQATATSRGAARPSSLPRPALASVAVVYVFFAAAVPAGGARRGHVPRARRRRCCGPLRRRGRPRRCRTPRPRLHRHCRRRNFTAWKLPEAYQIMCNAATRKIDRYLCSAKIGERWSLSIQYSCKFAR